MKVWRNGCCSWFNRSLNTGIIWWLLFSIYPRFPPRWRHPVVCRRLLCERNQTHWMTVSRWHTYGLSPWTSDAMGSIQTYFTSQSFIFLFEASHCSDNEANRICSLESLQRLVRTYWSVVLCTFSTWGWKERWNGCRISSLGCVLPLGRLFWQWTDIDKTSRFYFCSKEHRSLLRCHTFSKRKSRLEIPVKKKD